MSNNQDCPITPLINSAEDLARQGELEKACNIYERALQIEANSATLAQYVATLVRHAEDLTKTGRTELSLEYFERALSIEENHTVRSHYVAALVRHARDLVEDGRAGESLGYFERALKIRPDNSKLARRYATALAYYAKDLADGGRADESFQYFERALESRPNSAETLSNYVDALLKSDNVNQYTQVKLFHFMKRALEMEPSNPMLAANYVDALTRSGNATDLIERVREITPDNKVTLADCAKVLAGHANSLIKNGYTERSFEFFERALQIQPKNAKTRANYAVALGRHANALSKSNKAKHSFEYFVRALEVEPNDAITLSNYANALAKSGNTEQSFEYFKRSLEINPNNAITLSNYANALARSDKTEQSFEYFVRALDIEPRNVITLSNYANALARTDKAEQAFEYFDRALEIEPNDAITLSHYARALAKVGMAEQSFGYFIRSLQINPNDAITLSNYANALAKSDKPEQSFEYFVRALEIEPNNAITLSNCASFLAKSDKVDEALKYYQRALEIEPNNRLTRANYAYALGRHANTLIDNDRIDEALEYFQHALRNKPDNPYVLFKTAETLQSLGRYADAADKLEQILSLDTPDADHFIVRLRLGRLYSLLDREEDGRQQLDTAIEQARNADAAKLRIARELMTASPRDEYANDLLREIAETSPRYMEAQDTLGLNLDSGSHFEAFGQNAAGRLQDQTALNRALYHKINNRIAILREVLYEKLVQHEDPLLRDLVDQISGILKGIKERRACADRDSQTGKLGSLNYSATLNVIAETAHDIADFVGNKISSIREQLWESHNALSADDGRIVLYEDLRKHFQRASDALNDLKRINEGIRLQAITVPLKELFDPWLKTPTLRNGHARIQVEFSEASQSVTLDVQKVRGFLDELMENSLKHNAEKVKNADLHIEFSVSITAGLPLGRDGKMIPIPGVEYLNIRVKDNGKGVAPDQKEWIFQPLATTSQDGEGTGLGLFDIRRTVERMGGFIRETGIHGDGACFELYILLGTSL